MPGARPSPVQASCEHAGGAMRCGGGSAGPGRRAGGRRNARAGALSAVQPLADDQAVTWLHCTLRCAARLGAVRQRPAMLLSGSGLSGVQQGMNA